jgi:hypothetical protein
LDARFGRIGQSFFLRQQSPSSLQTTAADAPAVKARVPRTAKAAVLKHFITLSP